MAILGVGFYFALTARFGERLGPAPAVAATNGWGASGYRVVALGDSLTWGTGDTPERGYVERVVEDLRRRGRSVSVANLAVPGDETEDLLALLARPATRQRVKDAHLILMSIGGNDFTHALRGRDRNSQAAPQGPGSEPQGGSPAQAGEDQLTEQEIDEQLDVGSALPGARANLKQIVSTLRSINPSAPIRILGLYNPFEVLPSAEARVRAQLLEWNVAIEQAALDWKNVLAVPIADLFTDRPDRLAGDRFHPGPDGHEAIAARVFSTLRDSD